MKRKVLAVVLTMALVGVIGSPAGGSVKCPKFKPKEPSSDSNQRSEAVDAKVEKVTEKNDADNPVSIGYTQGPGLWATADSPPLLEDSVFMNFQALSKAKPTRTNVRLEWSTPSLSDIDLYIYDSKGSLVFQSIAFNAQGGGDDAMGYEQMLEMAMAPCAGFTVESRVSSGAVEDMTALVWLS